ncbi:P22 coat protein - protein 5 domain protein [Thermoanaerobacteraceae bacterium SP2]|nr:P22 coat protein - protein 5 domain protein [Thermoanaerobacteraceae bacterium SP2]
MAIDNFIPTIWSARLLQNLQKSLVYGQTNVVNRDYEGEIRDVGNTVKINNIGPITVGTYTKNTNIGDPEALNGDQTTLVIDQAKYFNFQVDDIDRAQQNPKVMDDAMREAAYALADAADQYIAGLYTGVAAGNTIGDDTTPVVPTKADAYEHLVDMAIILDDNKVPRANRWVVVPPWFYGLLLKDDRFVKAGTPTSDQVLRNGEVGQAAGFTVLVSHNVPNTAGTKYKIIAGSTIAITYAEQINKVEAYRPEKRFADAVKGLHLYGAKLVRPEAIVVMTANKA